jgi:small GTP-binding protein
MGILEKIKEIEAEMARTQKNKATEHHLGLLKAKLAKLRAQLLEHSGKGGGKGGEGFAVLKSGDARVAMVGFPSVVKSTLLTLLTETKSEAAAYEFTTLTCIPGKLQYMGANIQLLDMPGIIEGAAHGKGRGRQVVAVAKTADLILLMLDATKDDRQIEILENELHTVGIRLNTRPPDIYFRIKKAGGVAFNTTVPLTHVNEKLCKQILHEYKIHNAEVLMRCDATVDEFIDVVIGRAAYIPCLYVYNKIDQLSIEEVDKLARRPNTVVISCGMQLNLHDGLLPSIWTHLNLNRVYTKRRGMPPDFSEPLVMRRDATVEDVICAVHRDLVDQFKYALIWGASAKHTPQRVGLKHKVADEDVIFIAKK